MQCSKCNGLTVKDGPDEYRCLLCSKRTYTFPKDVRDAVDESNAHPLVKAVADMPTLSDDVSTRARNRCAFVLDRGTRCKTDACFESDFCRRHEPVDTAMKEKHPMPAPTTTPTPKRAELPDLFLPQELKFVCSREQRDFGRFTLVWSLKFPEYELDTIVENKDDDTQVNVWLRLKKESLDASKSAA